jgi:starch phosphorylase
MRELLDRHLGDGWLTRATDPATWEPVQDIPDDELWAARCTQRSQLVDYVRAQSARDRLSRGEHRDYVEAAARAFDPEVLTIGFARRVATYKRLTLMMSDPERAIRLLEADRPIQILIAGKAHPRDDGGKSLIQALFHQRGRGPVGSRVIFLQDYDLAMAARLTRGCDVWVNVPRPPLEASGTSGMKSSMNGGLNLSVLDGWWPEAYDGTNGWAISGEVEADHQMQDGRDGAELYRLLEEEVVPTYYDHRAAWVAKVKRALMTVGPQFGAGRMVGDYAEQLYAQVATPA